MQPSRVRILFFALYRDLAGTDQLELVVPDGATVRTLVGRIRARSGMDRLPEEPVVAVNRAYAGLDEPVRDGDEVAFLPPVAGG